MAPSEKRVFKQFFDGKKCQMPSFYKKMVQKIPSRSKEMIRTRCNNIKTGKQFTIQLELII